MDAPETPDPYETASAQQMANVGAGASAAIMNNYNEDNPYAKVKYKKIGAEKVQDAMGNWIKVPRFKKVTTLKPEQQAMLNQQNQLGTKMNDMALGQVDRLSSVLGEPINFDDAPSADAPSLIKDFANFDSFYDADKFDIQAEVGPTDFSEDRRRVEDAMMARGDEMYGKDIAAQDARLAAMGISPSNEAARADFYDIDKTRNDMRMQAILAGGQEQSRMAKLEMDKANFKNNAQGQAFGQAAQRTGMARDEADFSNSASMTEYGAQASDRDRYIRELLTKRNQPINEISTLMGGGQVTLPDFPAPYQQGVAAAPVGDYIYRGWEGEQQAQQAMMDNIFGLVGQALPW